MHNILRGHDVGGHINAQAFSFHLLLHSSTNSLGSMVPRELYSLCQKKRTFNPEFFCSPPGGGGPKIHMVNYVS